MSAHDEPQHRLARSPGGVLVLDTPGEPIPAVLLNDEPPPVDEDAAAEARAYERGRADILADVLAFLESRARGALTASSLIDDAKDPVGFTCFTTIAETCNTVGEVLSKRESDRLATKQGAASS